jgi:hypothetical protein
MKYVLYVLSSNELMQTRMHFMKFLQQYGDVLFFYFLELDIVRFLGYPHWVVFWNECVLG